jgi:hypothetical protein
MKLPSQNELRKINTTEPRTIAEAYVGQLLLIEMSDGTTAVYDGEYGMELSRYWEAADLSKDLKVNRKLTKLIQKHFPNVKSVKVADL